MSGTIWMYSQYIDDEDLEFAKKEFITYKMGREYYGLGEKHDKIVELQSSSKIKQIRMNTNQNEININLTIIITEIIMSL